MIPKGFQHHHFISAIKEIDRDGVPRARESRRYDLLVNRKKYPPKYVISIAGKYLDGKELPFTNFNAVTAKDYFIRNGTEFSIEQMVRNYPSCRQRIGSHDFQKAKRNTGCIAV